MWIERKSDWNLNSEQDCPSETKIHPWSLTWKLKICPGKGYSLPFGHHHFRFHVISYLSNREIIFQTFLVGAILVAARVVDEWASDSGDVLLECFPDAGGGSWNGYSNVLMPSGVWKDVFAQTPQRLQVLCQEHEKESWNGGLWLLAML